MKTRLEKTLLRLKALQVDHFHPVLWIVKRTLRAGAASYTVASVTTDEKLKKKLRQIAANAVKSANHVEEYDFMSGDQDDGLALGLELKESDFRSIAELINHGSDLPKIESAEQLFDSWAYVIELHNGQEKVLALHKISEGWKLKQKEKLLNVLFKDRMLLDFEELEVFKLERTVDCFAYDGMVFILDKKRFESALNFRVGMEKNRDDVLSELHTLGVIDGTKVIQDTVSNRLNPLRRLSMIKKNGYYRKPEFMSKLQEVCTTKGWDVKFEGNKMVVTHENAELVLKLLNDDRLASLLQDTIYDVSAKKKVDI